MAGRGAAAARHRPLYRLRRAHPRPQDRRSRAHPRARARLLLYRRARLEEDAWPAPRPPESAGPARCRAGPHPRANRSRYRRGVALRDRGRDYGPDHGAAATVAGEEPMKFGAVPVAEAEGAVAVHSIRNSGIVLKKGTLIGKAEIAALEAGGIAEIVVARVEPGDVPEDAAAAEIAAAVAGEGVGVDRAFTGRANLFAETAGVLVVDKEAIDRLNRVDESITFATLAAFKPVVAGEMIATVKIIPFAVASRERDAALAIAKAVLPLTRVAPYRIRKIGIVSTLLPGLATKVIEKTLKVTQERLAPAGANIIGERRVAHEQHALAAAIDELLGAGAEQFVDRCGKSVLLVGNAALPDNVRTRRRQALLRHFECLLNDLGGKAGQQGRDHTNLSDA